MAIYSSQHFLQLLGEQVPLKSAFQTFTRHFKEFLLCSRLESGIRNENEHEAAGEEIIGNHASTSANSPQRTHPKPASATSFDKDLFFCLRKRQIPARCQQGRQKSRCKECGGSSICNHGKLKQLCAQCDGSSLCSHLKRKWICRECKGSSLCNHGRRNTKCKICTRPNLSPPDIPSGCRIDGIKLIFTIVHRTAWACWNSREKTQTLLSDDAKANHMSYALLHMLLAITCSPAADIQQLRYGTSTNIIDTPYELQHCWGAHIHLHMLMHTC
jgi:hypothetical protein